MTDRPIIFSAPMVRALLGGRKTQTRRLAWGKPFGVDGVDDLAAIDLRNEGCKVSGPDDTGHRIVWPPSLWQRVQPGDRLWVRENFRVQQVTRIAQVGGARLLVCVDYDADAARIHWNIPETDAPKILRQRGKGPSGQDAALAPCIHLPRQISRVTLTLTEVRRQRLREISPDDCLAEGIPPITDTSYWAAPIPREPNLPATYKGAFCKLWCDLHGADAWEDNPEVVPLTFSVERRNIDAPAPAPVYCPPCGAQHEYPPHQPL